MKSLFLLVLFIVSSTVVAKMEVLNNKDAKDLAEKGIQIEVSSRIILNKHMKEKKMKPGQLYKVSFVCEHKKKKENCQLVSVE